jgi:hypothetical protein
MTDERKFKGLENRLNKDDSLRREFLKDPVKVLKREGVEVTPAMASNLKAQFKDLQLKKLPRAAAVSIRIRVCIGVTF